MNSSLLLYPYSPIVNLINHSSQNPSVRLQWAANQESLEWPLERVLESKSSSGLLLELVALRDIEEGQEILMDYGREWQQAWNEHVHQWKPLTEPYVPSFNFSIDFPRTEEELRQNPYPSNLLTSCCYRYGARDHESSEGMTMDRWNEGIMYLRNLRPCAILGRHAGDERYNEPLYAVQIHNSFGLKGDERVPKGKVHVVTHVPRIAIRFSDKLYTTDPHLRDTFRHEIGLASFPPQWMDLASKE